jgi:hypothetical protein
MPSLDCPGKDVNDFCSCKRRSTDTLRYALGATHFPEGEQTAGK